VSERTREIGIRKSIGARRGDIVLQFLMEAVMLSLGGGTLGLGLAIGIILAASGFLANRFGSFVVSYGSVVLLAFVFSSIVGLLFGVYPAIRASRLDPVEALRS
jgi:ABC-type antimicrobial peptide transport system permease subunit